MKIYLQKPQKINLKNKKVLFLPFFSGEKIRVDNPDIKREISKFDRLLESIKEQELKLVFLEKRQFIFLDLGKREKWNQRKFLLAIRRATIFLKENRLSEASFVLEAVIPKVVNQASLVRQIPENILMADYEFNRYKEKPKEGWPEIKSIEIIWPDSQKYQKELANGKIIGQNVNFVRDLANIPGGEMTPQKMAEAAKKAVRKAKSLKVEILDEKKIKKLGMGGILGVGQASSQKPRLIILKYIGNKSSRNFDLAFVGKGVTFDTGGLDIKPFEAMKDGVHMDMSGGAAVLGAILAVSQMKSPINIVGIIPAVENMISGQALRPGDIIKSYNGKTIEVVSTDAEGRIILADALSYAIKNYKPKLIIDVATLTGAAIVALGKRATALFTNLSKMEKTLSEIGEDSGDYVWPLPCWEEYEEEIKGTFGDISNLGKYPRCGGAITAALFLKYFVEESPWIHLDIASTMTSIDNQGLSGGATGSGLRYLVELTQRFKNIESKLNLS